VLTTPPSPEWSSYGSGELGLPGSPGTPADEASSHDAALSFDETFMALVVDQPQRPAVPSEAPVAVIDATVPLSFVDVAVMLPEWQRAEPAADGDASHTAAEDDGRWWDDVPEDLTLTAESAPPQAQPGATIDSTEPPRAIVSGPSAVVPPVDADRGVPAPATPAGVPKTELPGSAAAATNAAPRPGVTASSPPSSPPSAHDAVPVETAPELPRLLPQGPDNRAHAAAHPGGGPGEGDGIPAPPPNIAPNEANDAATTERRGTAASATVDDLSGDTHQGEEKSSNPRATLAARRFSARLEGLTEGSEQRPGEAVLGARGTTNGVLTGDARAAAAPPGPLSAAATPLVRPAEPAPESLGRLIQAIRVQARGSVSEATVTLQPEHLGEVTIAIRLDRGAVSAVVRAEAANVREWLRGQEESIRNGLSDQGLQLERFVVQRDRARERREPPPQAQERPRGRRDAGPEAPRFEVAA
jgi:hypothetical protein